ncbi:phage cell wall peptidase of NlpC/P60 family protein [Megasphaera sp. BL7]|jgi:NlpC/P60 family putative phage cell wall peptidase|uniref:NlpC/P60 family protein n=1 Tax=unclassified Megasphaera TaxID=2626256 RepID=UPI0003573813|nr:MULTISPECIES: NlpC/P60 family protein [unclassified Megasphaera]EPP14214.1 phage cell wall peptidase of NlpC/P60 family protein [Megasphaera sp. BL7]EPP18774.1 phage cell wall peptidase of NlpC/P60 family protein [Megasphaera sp. NM10]
MKPEDIINEARQWIGCRWEHQACLKGVACDCVGLVRGVHEQLTGDAFEGDYDYPATWHLFKRKEKLYEECKKYMDEISVSEARPGDILLFAFRTKFPAHHLAILTDQDTLIHSYMDVGRVVESAYTDDWKQMTRFAFRFREVK